MKSKRTAVVALVVTGALLQSTGTAFAGVPGSIHNEQSIKTAPSFKAPDKFRARHGERVDIICYTVDPDAATIQWEYVHIRGATGWAAGVVRDDPAQPIPRCGPSGRA